MIATTRPETMLADVAVAVNPDDERYRDLIGKHVRLPIVERAIPVIADAYADPAFGTGVVKITPAHDANDFEVGRRHSLAMPVVIDEHGVVREVTDADGRVPAVISGLDRFDARERIVEMLAASGALQRSRAAPARRATLLSLRHGGRAAPVRSVVREDGAARAAGAARRARWRDSNSARAVGSGVRELAHQHSRLEHLASVVVGPSHSRVVLRECEPPQDIIVSRDDITECPHCGGAGAQDEDVLDTWFSSWLWPISTLGWPDEKSQELAAFYPTDTLVTAPEILFFWVARMIMSGYEFMGAHRIHTVYLHGTARDTQHRKMSKSLGNGIDPLDVVKLYGADALRWTLIAGMGMGADVILDPNDIDKSFATGRNFGTKLWNIGRFLLDRVGTDAVDSIDALERGGADACRRMDSRPARCGDRRVRSGAWTTLADDAARFADERVWQESERYAGLRLNEYAETARRFVWNELADWYLESVKARLEVPGRDRDVARAVLVHAFDARFACCIPWCRS